MKKLCFVEMEGVLLSHKNYKANERRVTSFVSELAEYCGQNKIELYLISGFHESVAVKKHAHSLLDSFFDKKHFLFVNDTYISKKQEADARLHRDGLAKDPEFVDSYFKQVAMKDVVDKRHLFPSDALLLSDDLWVDGYYTNRFSKLDFAIFEENILDRGKPAEPISGLAYFSLNVESVKPLLANFPKIDFSALDKYVFEAMKNILIGDTNFANVVRKSLEKKKG